MHHVALDRARSDDGHLDHEIVEASRLQARQHGHLGAGFDLEDAQAVRRAQHGVGGGILGRDLVHRRRREGVFAPAAPLAGQQPQGLADGREHAEAEHVDLQQVQGFEVVLVPLDDGAFGHGSVLDGNQPGERPGGDDETADMLGEMPGKAEYLVDQKHELAGDRAFALRARPLRGAGRVPPGCPTRRWTWPADPPDPDRSPAPCRHRVWRFWAGT